MSLRVPLWLKVWLLPGLILAWLWFSLINHLRIEWSVNPQYSYGWAVPFLCLYLIYHGRQESEARNQKSEVRGQGREDATRGAAVGNTVSDFRFQNLIVAVFGMLWLPVRLVEEANPQWRLSVWALALTVVGLTLALLWRLFVDSGPTPSPPRLERAREGEASGPSTPHSRFPLSTFRIQNFVFPILFFLVAVPWPTLVEAPVIQSLTRANTAVTIEIVNLLGIPAVQHGNVIEVGSGMVGIDEGCSGIRSFQATLMISLFLGALWRLSVLRRLTLCLSGFVLSFVFNVGRTTLLTWVASRQGIKAIDRWHDPAGVTILVGCFLSLWLLGQLLSRRRDSAPSPSPTRNLTQDFNPPSDTAATASNEALSAGNALQHSAFKFRPRFLAFLAAWLLLSEIMVEGWYRWHERGLGPEVTWVMQAPTENPSYREMDMPETPKVILRATDTLMGAWQEPGGLRWQAIFLRWAPGRVAAHLAQGHTPDLCLPAAGRKLVSVSLVQRVAVHGLTLPVRYYAVEEASGLLHVAYCQWQDRKADQSVRTEDIVTWRSRLANISHGRRNLGQRSLELAVWGINDPAQAEAAFHAELEKLIRVEQ